MRIGQIRVLTQTKINIKSPSTGGDTHKLRIDLRMLPKQKVNRLNPRPKMRLFSSIFSFLFLLTLISARQMLSQSRQR